MSNNDNHAKQCNPNQKVKKQLVKKKRKKKKKSLKPKTNELRYESDVSYDSYDDTGTKTQDDWDNYSNQLNPNNDAYWSSRK